MRIPFFSSCLRSGPVQNNADQEVPNADAPPQSRIHDAADHRAASNAPRLNQVQLASPQIRAVISMDDLIEWMDEGAYPEQGPGCSTSSDTTLAQLLRTNFVKRVLEDAINEQSQATQIVLMPGLPKGVDIGHALQEINAVIRAMNPIKGCNDLLDIRYEGERNLLQLAAFMKKINALSIFEALGIDQRDDVIPNADPIGVVTIDDILASNPQQPEDTASLASSGLRTVDESHNPLATSIKYNSVEHFKIALLQGSLQHRNQAIQNKNLTQSTALDFAAHYGRSQMAAALDIVQIPSAHGRGALAAVRMAQRREGLYNQDGMRSTIPSRLYLLSKKFGDYLGGL